MMENIFARAAELIKTHTPFVFCMITATQGSTPRKAGAKMLVLGDGSLVGTIGGGILEREVVSDALSAMKSGEIMLRKYRLEEDLSMKCGGDVEIFIEPFAVNSRLLIFGAGHVGRAVGKLAAGFGFQISFIDNRPEIFREFSVAGAECITGDYIESLNKIPFDDKTYVVICTPEHSYDEAILEAIAKKNCAYIGMMGSRRKVAEVRAAMLEKGIMTAEELDRINMPVGVEMTCETPEEIALSIVAKLVDVRNKRRKA